MNLAALDWLIIAGFFVFVVGTALYSRPLVRSVADFLAAGRTAGRYVLSVSQGPPPSAPSPSSARWR